MVSLVKESYDAATQGQAVAEIAKEDPEAAGLVYQIITASMDANNRTIDSLLDGKDEQIKDLCRSLIALGEVLDQATVIDRKTEWRLGALEHHIHNARWTLARMEDHT